MYSNEWIYVTKDNSTRALHTDLWWPYFKQYLKGVTLLVMQYIYCCIYTFMNHTLIWIFHTSLLVAENGPKSWQNALSCISFYCYYWRFYFLISKNMALLKLWINFVQAISKRQRYNGGQNMTCNTQTNHCCTSRCLLTEFSEVVGSY